MEQKFGPVKNPVVPDEDASSKLSDAFLQDLGGKLDALYHFSVSTAVDSQVRALFLADRGKSSQTSSVPFRRKPFRLTFLKTEAESILLKMNELVKDAPHPGLQFYGLAADRVIHSGCDCLFAPKKNVLQIGFKYSFHFDQLTDPIVHFQKSDYHYSKDKNDPIEKRLETFELWFVRELDQFRAQCEQTRSELDAITPKHSLIRNHYKSNLENWVARVRKYVEKEKKELINRSVKKQIGEISYFDLFPMARGLQRKIIFYVGPTNSGKTYHGFGRLLESDQGVYLAPLRLMALEGKEEIEKRGATCSLVTGEEKFLVEGARFQSSTVEMVDFDRPIDAALIDEIQMLGDEDRGSAFTAALVGVPARTVILTGSPTAIPIVKKLAERMGEELEIVKLERLTKLIVQKQAVDFKTRFSKGTAIVAFSRSDIIAIREGLLNEGYTVSVIYGGLGPEVRKEEARRFREGETDILVASDAIGMGLNLPIHRLIFFTLEKFNGSFMGPLSRASIQQIAGRAGRFNLFPVGEVGAFKKNWLAEIEHTLHERDFDIPRARTAPRLFQIEQFMVDTGATFYEAFRYLSDINTADCFDSGVTETALYVAQALEPMDLSIKDRFCLIHAPIDMKNENSIGVFLGWAENISKDTEPNLPRFLLHRSSELPSAKALGDLEQKAKLLMVFRWLHQRFPKIFVNVAEANDQLEWIDSKIMAALKARISKRCAECNEAMDHFSRHAKCDKCFFASRKPKLTDSENDIENDYEGAFTETAPKPVSAVVKKKKPRRRPKKA